MFQNQTYEKEAYPQSTPAVFDSKAVGNHTMLSSFQQEGDQPIQGQFDVKFDKGLTNAHLSKEAFGRMDMLRKNLQDIYEDMYDQDWEITLAVSRFTISTPAWTELKKGNENEIEVVFSRWFLERCSYGELLGLANHELAVHIFADISLASATSITEYGSIPSEAVKTLEEDIDKLRKKMDNAMLSRALKTKASPGGEPWITRSLIRHLAHYPIDAEEGVYANKKFEVAFGEVDPFTLEAPKTIEAHGGQPDHAYMSHINGLAQYPGIFSPRAAVYAKMSLRALDTYITSCILSGKQNEAEKEAPKILGYYFLDIARTWEEGIRGTTLKPFATMVGPQMRDAVLQMTTAYFDWMISENGEPNQELLETVSQATITTLKEIRPIMKERLTEMNGELTSLMWRAARSIGIGVARLGRDALLSPFRLGWQGVKGIGKLIGWGAGKAGQLLGFGENQKTD